MSGDNQDDVPPEVAETAVGEINGDDKPPRRTSEEAPPKVHGRRMFLLSAALLGAGGWAELVREHVSRSGVVGVPLSRAPNNLALVNRNCTINDCGTLGGNCTNAFQTSCDVELGDGTCNNHECAEQNCSPAYQCIAAECTENMDGTCIGLDSCWLMDGQCNPLNICRDQNGACTLTSCTVDKDGSCELENCGPAAHGALLASDPNLQERGRVVSIAPFGMPRSAALQKKTV